MPTPPKKSTAKADASSRKLVSYVLPIYNEQGTIELLHQTLVGTVAQRPDLDFEFVYVNDGSRDRSIERLIAVQASDDRVRVLDLSRNFGHQMAVTAGLDFAAGDAVVVMDSDMQDPPAVSLQLIERWLEGYDVVYAQRRTRKDGVFKRFSAFLFYRALRTLADIDIPRDTGDFRLISRQVVEAMGSMREHNRFLRGMVSFVGYKQVAVPFDRDERHAGVTGYPLRKMISFAADGIMGFSSFPLRLISRIGFLFSAVSFLGILYVLIAKLFWPETVIQGWSFTIISMLLIGGIQMIMIGVLGNYIARIYSEVQGRPLYLIGSIHGAPVRGQINR